MHTEAELNQIHSTLYAAPTSDTGKRQAHVGNLTAKFRELLGLEEAESSLVDATHKHFDELRKRREEKMSNG